MKEIFNLESYDILDDNDNYYLFRALNKEDNFDIENNITTDNNGNILKIRTDRERYSKNPLYSIDSPLSLKQIFDHIKMHHRKDTNCISLTTNANVSILYGREYYKDRYVIIKIPKKEIGFTTYNAGLYMIEEINNRINTLINNKELSDEIIIYLHTIDKVKSKEELDILIHSFKKDENTIVDSMFEKGIEYSREDITTVDYQALNKEQNLEKDKIVAKLNLIKKNILPNVSNRFLIQTIGNAFSSLELIHYNEINKEKIIEIPKEIIDIFSLIQQLPNNYPKKKELKSYLLNLVLNGNYNVETFEYDNINLNTSNDYTIDKMYELTNGSIDYKSTINLYKKSFYLAKSKLRTLFIASLLTKLIDNNSNYDDILNYLLRNTYGVEPIIFSRLNSNKYQVSESVNLDINTKEMELFNFINSLLESDLRYIISKPMEALKYYINNFTSIKEDNISMKEYYANAIIDLFDWSRINVTKFDEKRRNDLVNKLIENNVVYLYEYLKNKKIPEENISNTLLTIAIKGKLLDKIDLNDTFTIEELDDFMGYYRLKETRLKLKNYQVTTLKNINKIHIIHNFASAILPTGTGKTFIALAEMLEYKDKEILYLAPNDVILNQIKDYIIEYICGDTNKKSRDELIKEVFPNLTLATYQSLLSFNEQYKEDGRVNHKIINHKYDLIIFDELHRSGALEWNKQINELLGNQKDKTKVLGITATPERDVDLVNMADYWAEKYGFTEDEILRHKHIAMNMDLEEAIKLGYVINPKKVECLYTLEESGYFESLNSKIDTIQDEEKKQDLIKKLNFYRKQALNADGIEKVIGDNIKLGGRYIVFCPVINDLGAITEDEDGNIIDSRITGVDVINKYIEELINLLKKYYNISSEELNKMLEFHSMLGKYGSAKNNRELKKFERKNKKKIKFMIVMNKLNEGSHAKNDGLIWFRTLDVNSRILYSQQMGRVIYAKNPNEEINDDDLPIIIDIPCNSLMVGLNKRGKVSDLDKIIPIYGWIQDNNKIPDLNSNDRVEARYGNTLKYIKEKYVKYIDSNLLDNLSNKQKKEVLEILDVGSKIDLWSYDFPDKINKNNNKNNSNNDITPFSISGFIKDLYKFEEEVNENTKLPDIEDRLEEIRNLGFIPLPNSQIKFKDKSAFIGGWIFTHKDEIIKLYDSNETAKWICDGKKWLITIEDRLEEIRNLGFIPLSNNQIKFKDKSAFIGGWIFTHKDEIIKLSDSNETAKWICDEKGWLITIEDRLEEIKSLGFIPLKTDQIKFKDGYSFIGSWIYTNKKEIIKLYDSNETARWICDEKKWLITTEDKLEEIRNLGFAPSSVSQIKFKDNSSFIGSWISKHKKEIIKLSDSNEIAKWICDEKGWLITIEDRLEEIRNLGFVPAQRDQIKFKGQYSLIGNWIYTNKAEIIKLSDSNDNARWICDEKGWLITIEDRLEEIKSLGFVPTQRDQIKFKDGALYIGSWIFHQKDELIKLSKTNETARWICDEKKWLITTEDRLEEIKNLGVVPSSESQIKFKDNSSLVGKWIHKHKKEIIILSDSNDNAKWICDEKRWIIDKIGEYIELLNKGYIPKSKETNIKFSNGDIINQFWNPHKLRIMKRLQTDPKYQTGYELAKRIIYIKSLPTKEQRKLLLDLKDELLKNITNEDTKSGSMKI